jgi:hypothetical protein
MLNASYIGRAETSAGTQCGVEDPGRQAATDRDRSVEVAKSPAHGVILETILIPGNFVQPGQGAPAMFRLWRAPEALYI